MKTPMILISGALGSGKTTLLRHLIAHADRKIAILMNEFGEVAIDSRVVQGEHIQMTELAGGCVCCSLVGEFEAAVREITQRVGPALIVVETTGVAEPDAVIFDVEDSLPEVRLDSVIVIADADGMVRFPDLGYVTRAQFEAADVVLVNKLDLVSQGDLEAVEARLCAVNPDAAKLRTLRCEVDPSLLFGMDMAGRSRPAPGVGHHHDSEIGSFVYRSNSSLDRSRFESVAARLSPQIYRAKGFLRCADGDFLFNFVAGHWELEPFEADQTELVFIGKGAEEVRESVLNKLQDCEV